MNTKILKHPINDTFYVIKLTASEMHIHISYDACNNWVKNVPTYTTSGQTELSAVIQYIDPDSFIDIVLSNGPDIETVTFNCDTHVITSNGSFSANGSATLADNLVVITR